PFTMSHDTLSDANTTQKNPGGSKRGKHNTHQYGGPIGGPLRANRAFLFFIFEGLREIDPFPVVSDTPPLDLRTGNFKKYNIHVYDPNTAHACDEDIDTPGAPKCLNTFIRSPFPNNHIPLARIIPIGRAILDVYPAPNSNR